MPAPDILIFTDLDGTLLDHFDYGHDAAVPLLQALEEAGIPVIPATSKTRAELMAWRAGARNSHPLVVENGAAVVIPQAYFSALPEKAADVDGFHQVSFVQPRAHWQKLLEEARRQFPDCWHSFAQLGVQGIADLTGLDPAEAALASRREFGEPLHWLGSDDDLDRFRRWMHDHGATVLLGGRFVHVSGACDKGRALRWLTDLYQRQPGAGRIATIALGDSDNDVAMLRAADYPVIVRSPNRPAPAVYPAGDADAGRCRITSRVAPDGWVEGVTAVLSELRPELRLP